MKKIIAISIFATLVACKPNTQTNESAAAVQAAPEQDVAETSPSQEEVSATLDVITEGVVINSPVVHVAEEAGYNDASAFTAVVSQSASFDKPSQSGKQKVSLNTVSQDDDLSPYAFF